MNNYPHEISDSQQFENINNILERSLIKKEISNDDKSEQKIQSNHEQSQLEFIDNKTINRNLWSNN